jgi:hypothetical protein
MREPSIFMEALEREDPAERAPSLDQACATDPDAKAAPLLRAGRERVT